MTSKCIAIVDDDEFLRDALDNLMRSAGHRAVRFGSAEDFLDRDCGSPPDLLLTDYCLGGINGVELIGILRKEGDLIPALVMSAHDIPALKERALAAGAFAFLEKPFLADELLDLIDTALTPGATGGNGAD